MGDDAVPMIEPCKDSASKDRCLCTSMKTGMRSPGLYWIGRVVLDSWVSEQSRDRESGGLVVRIEGMLSIGGVGLLILGNLGCW